MYNTVDKDQIAPG